MTIEYAGVNHAAVSGTILSCIAAGVPEPLLIPCRPWDKPDKRGEGAGKAPAVPDPAFPDGTGAWIGLQGWESGNLATARLLAADASGANAGLLLGMPAEFPDGQRYSVLAIDVDLEPEEPRAGSRQSKSPRPFPYDPGTDATWPVTAIVASIRKTFTKDQSGYAHDRHRRWTVPHRALYLVTVPKDALSRKLVWEVRHKPRTALFNNGVGAENPDKVIGKIELLAKGQQAVIAGIHPSGYKICWRRDNVVPRDVPPIREFGLEPFASFEDIVGKLQTAFDALHEKWPEFTLTLLSDEGSRSGTADDVDPLTLAPAHLTADDVVRVFEDMANPTWVDREKYKDIMLASGGTMRGILAHSGILHLSAEPTADDFLVADAAARWAERWEGKKPGQCDYETERQKWLSDWRINGKVAGWTQLQGHADRLSGGAEFDCERRSDPAAADLGSADTGPTIDLDTLGDRPPLKVEFASEFQVEANLPLVDGWIDRGELVAVVGPPGSFKTTLAADMACCVAWEHPWMGCKTEGGSVWWWNWKAPEASETALSRGTSLRPCHMSLRR